MRTDIVSNQDAVLPADLALTEMVVLQGTPYCNLNCSYCDLSAASRKQRHTMSLSTIERVFSDVFAHVMHASTLSVVWHSGEPLTLSPDYYQQAIDLIYRLRNNYATSDVELTFDFQTNGVLISEPWIRFFKANKDVVRIGVSCDGPAHIHDAYRTNWGGKTTHDKVLLGMSKLRDNHIEFKVIAVVSDVTMQDPDGFFDFFVDWFDSLSGFHFNILADGSSAANPKLNYNRSDSTAYYRFYRHLLHRTRELASSGFAFQNFTQAIDRLQEDTVSQVEQASQPARTINVDAEGTVTTFYAGLDRSTFPEQYGDGLGLSLGNINRQIQSDFKACQNGCNKHCAYFKLCPGGFELSQLSEQGSFYGGETKECKIIVKTLIDAVLDDINEQVA